MITEEQARILLANIYINDDKRRELYIDEIEETIKRWKQWKWIMK